ncbi:MAG: hypothetical protein GVY26_03885 [Bacteroidetes bacterium]|jgi:hypothetical protein|nr:hypothetical protein [Bacteroidota bacterium]
MPRPTHGNSNKSRRKHHLYEIRDKVKDDVYKYGICGDPLNKDGSSPRGNKQVRLFNNLVEWSRFFARILLTGIPGRRKAKEIETEYIERYRQKHGKPPRGNRD